MAKEKAVEVRVTGRRETEVALAKLAVEAPEATKLALVEAGKPMVSEARRLLSDHQGASLNTIKARPTIRGVEIIQEKGPVTGDHPNFGSLVIVEGIYPAVKKHEDDAVRAVGLAIDRLAITHGF